jgi:hypothetical protein
MKRTTLYSAAASGLALVSGLLIQAPGLALAFDGHNAQGQPCWATSGTVNGLFHAVEIGCTKDGSSPKPQPTAVPVQPFHAQPVQPVQAQPIQPVVQAQPVQAEPIQPVQAESVQPVQAEPVQANSAAATQDIGPDFFFHTYALSVPGAVWTTDDWANWVETTYVAPGVPNTGGIVINPDGTYVWNNTWEQRVIQGTWIPSTRANYAIQLQAAEGDRDWFVGRDTTGYSQDGTGITLWGGQSLADQYRGRLAE